MKYNYLQLFISQRSKAVRVKSEYKNDFVALNLDTEFKALKPVINASAVVAYNGL